MGKFAQILNSKKSQVNLSVKTQQLLTTDPQRSMFRRYQSQISSESNITRFYQQKKRVMNDDSPDDRTNLPIKKLSKLNENVKTELPITWKTMNTNVDCQLEIAIQPIDQPKDPSFTFKRNETKMDQMLNEFQAKLQFDGLSKDNRDQDTANEIDELLDDQDDSWFMSKDLNNVLNKIEKNVLVSKQDQSKESGIGSIESGSSYNSYELINKQRQKQTTELPNRKTELFKMPETPSKQSAIKINTSSVQFFSTPKTISRQTNKLNQSLDFENLSPIKSGKNDNNLINIKSDNKRSLNDTLNDQINNGQCKKLNNKILFRTTDDKVKNNELKNRVINRSINKQSNKQIKRPINNRMINDDFMFDDSLDVILTQMDDKELLKAKKQEENDDFDSLDLILSQIDDRELLKTKKQEENDDCDSLDLILSQVNDKDLLQTNKKEDYFESDDSFEMLLSQINDKELIKKKADDKKIEKNLNYKFKKEVKQNQK